MSSLPITLPPGFSPVVSKDDQVKAGTVIAERKDKLTNQNSIPVATLLGISEKKVPSTIRKNPGELFQKGEVIAAKKGMLWQTELVSNVSGSISGFDRESGTLVISPTITNEPDTITAPLDGKVSVCNNDQIVLSTNQKTLSANFGVGNKAEGILLLIAKQNEGVAGSEITVDMIDKVLLGEEFSLDALVKSAGMGVAGVIALSLNNDHVTYLSEKRLLIPIVTVEKSVFEALKQTIGRYVYIDGSAKSILQS